ncbi:MAG: ABC transporter permease [Alteromonadaceae bacterium]|nr:MAG: ABC transporter permease [Alteromonadaceae bacterium]
MQPNPASRSIRRIASKETTLFFASPIAYLFLAVFAGVTLFVFFWGEAFFSRNIADVRPLFEWMPVLLIFLCSTLTMRLWSEERRTGTLEHVLTQPVPLWQFVVGKFLGCISLLAIALLITLPLPITVSIIGNLDWGPVIAGYLAAFLLGAAYLSIGLFVSARSDNQIVSLIVAVAICGLFYLFGAPAITDFFGTAVGEWLRLLGSGSRFDAITRGVIDFRDLFYYISIILVFLTLNTFVLEKERWAKGGRQSHHRVWRRVSLLVIANALGANLWLGQVSTLRMDVTEGNMYSISDATKGYLNQLQEPLLLRGYFSAKTHPLLAPLIPQLRDLMREYQVVGQGRVRVEFIDPALNPELEEEANQKYGIQAVPFQIADRYQSTIVSSYFNVLVQYGSEHEVISFSDLIEAKVAGVGDIEVKLRNPEHDLTRTIKKVLKAYQAGGNLFETVQGDLSFKAYISADSTLPDELTSFKREVVAFLADKEKASKGRLSVSVEDPLANGGLLAEELAQNYGFQPMATSMFSGQSFYFYLTLHKDDQVIQIPVDDISKESFERNFDAALKRFASGFTKTVALVSQKSKPAYPGYGQQQGASMFRQLESFLSSDLNVEQEDLEDGSVGAQADILVLASPKDLSEKALFAVDQFLMRGGTVVAMTSPYSVEFSQRSMNMTEHTSGLEDWFAHHGLNIQKQLVMDTQNASFPVPVTRNVGGFELQDMTMLDYPYFIDVREGGLNGDNLITSGLPQVTLSWASPIEVNVDKNAQREIIKLIRSSDEAWLSSSTDIMPQATGASFIPNGVRDSYLLGVVAQGRFDSFFAGKKSPLIDAASDTPEAPAAEGEEEAKPALVIDSVIDSSSSSARIILISSNDTLKDQIVQMAGAGTGGQYLNTLQLVHNVLDWSLEDAGLLSIRSRGNFNRTLPPMEQSAQMFWEYLNYGLAALALLLIALVQFQRKKLRQNAYLAMLVS